MAKAKKNSITTHGGCPVERLANMQARLISAWQRLDVNGEWGEENRDVNGWNPMQMVNDWIDANEESASQVPVQSIRGALFQLILIADCVNIMDDCRHDLTAEHRGDDARRAIIRMIHSIAALLQRIGGKDEKLDVIMTYYMGDKLDPHRIVGDIVARV